MILKFPALVVASLSVVMVLTGGAEAATAAACTYESGIGDGTALPAPILLTGDGELNLGGCVFVAPAGGPWSFQASIVDNIWGTDIGGFICTDHDGDQVCGDEAKGEIAKVFCGVSPLVGPIPSGGEAAIFVDGPIFQGFLQQTVPDEIDGDPAGDCDPTANPVGGTRGTIVGVFA